MTNRDRLIQLITTLATVALAVLGARYGIPIPPPVVTVPPPAEQPAPMPAPRPPAPVPDPLAAIARIQFGSAGCSCTIIGERRSDGRYLCLTAAHCVSATGQHGTMRLRDGRTVGVVVQAINKTADCAWIMTDVTAETYPFALLAEQLPAVGARIWHAGYGVDVPGNREDGTFDGGPDSNGQVRMTLSVSSGDSGGGICLDESGRLISCVCCTAARGQRAAVWGAGPAAIRAAMPGALVMDHWKPIDIPVRTSRADAPPFRGDAP